MFIRLKFFLLHGPQMLLCPITLETVGAVDPTQEFWQYATELICAFLLQSTQQQLKGSSSQEGLSLSPKILSIVSGVVARPRTTKNVHMCYKNSIMLVIAYLSLFYVWTINGGKGYRYVSFQSTNILVFSLMNNHNHCEPFKDKSRVERAQTHVN